MWFYILDASSPNCNAILYFPQNYCCYSSCPSYLSDDGSVCVFRVCFDDIEVNYSSILYCAEWKIKAVTGFQVDLILSNFIVSSNINATHEISMHCASIQYSNCKSGFFKFQVLVNLQGAILTSFNNFNDVVELSKLQHY